MIIDNFKNDTVYFSISNYLGDNIKLTITEMEVKEDAEPPLGMKFGPIRKRYILPYITLSSNNTAYDLLDDKNTIKLPANDVTSFYFGINFLYSVQLKLQDATTRLDLNITYISPTSGEKKVLSKDIYRVGRSGTITYKY